MKEVKLINNMPLCDATARENIENVSKNVSKNSEDIGKLSEEKVDKPLIAEVGQIIAVKTVDENGSPTEFEAVDKASNARGNWFKIGEITIEESVSEVFFDKKENDESFEYTDALIVFKTGETGLSGWTKISGYDAYGNYQDIGHIYGGVGANKNQHSFGLRLDGIGYQYVQGYQDSNTNLGMFHPLNTKIITPLTSIKVSLSHGIPVGTKIIAYARL